MFEVSKVGGGEEAVAVYASNHKLMEQFPLSSGAMKITKLHFNEDTKIDPAII